MDWSSGRYEQIARQLLPAARLAVDRAAPQPGDRALDLGCGTGNAALLAAESGATVTGVDPSPRLLEVARVLAADRRLPATFLAGDAAAIPVADATVDVLVSVFGVIFAPDAPAAAAEMARVSAPSARVVLSAWIPAGPLTEAVRIRRQAVAASPGPPAGPSFDWHDPGELDRLLGPHGFSVEVTEEALAFTAASPEEFVEAELRDHPAWIAARAVLEPRGGLAAVRARILDLFAAANEEPGAFRLTSRYALATAIRFG
jgi:SAM-dependent methyltransferase